MADNSSQGLFSRRPSFFGGKTKGHKQTPSTLAPPALNITPAANPGLKTPPLQLDQYEFPARLAATPPRRRHASSRHSIASSVTDLGSTLRRSRSASLRTNTSASSSHKRTPSATLALTYSPEKAPVPGSVTNASRPALSISTFSRSKQKSSENVKTEGGSVQPQAQVYEKSPLSAVDKPKTPFGNMAVPIPLRHPPSQKEILQANQQSNRTLAPAAPIPVPNGSNPNLVFQHIHELASKRISTLDYLRKA